MQLWVPKLRHLSLEINFIAENLSATGHMIFLAYFQYLQQLMKPRLCLLMHISQITSNTSSALNMHLELIIYMSSILSWNKHVWK